MAWITTIDSNRRDERGRPTKRYRVGWHEIARDGDGQTIPRYPNRSDSRPKLVRRQETFDTYDEAKDRRNEINPKIARGQSPAALRDAGNRPLSHYAQAWLDGLAGRRRWVPASLPQHRVGYLPDRAARRRSVVRRGRRADPAQRRDTSPQTLPPL